MAKLGEAFVVINARLAPLRNALGRAFSMVRRGVSRMTKIAVAGFAALGIAALKFASDAEETANLFAVSMGDMHKESLKFTQDFSKALGLNIVDVQKYMGVFNVMIKGMGVGATEAAEMSKEFTKLVFDISSFRNLRPEEAFEKLRAGITGESEPLKALGIVMKDTTLSAFAMAQGINKSWKEMNEAERTILRYQFILSKTKDDQGDLERTSEGLANRWRKMTNSVKDLLAAIGGLFTDDAAKGLSVLSDWVTNNKDKIVGFFAELKEKTMEWVNEMGGFSGIVDKIKSAWDKVVPVLKDVKKILEAMVPIIMRILDGLAIISGKGRDNSSHNTIAAAKETKDNMRDLERRLAGQAAGVKGKDNLRTFSDIRAQSNPLSISDDRIARQIMNNTRPETIGAQ